MYELLAIAGGVVVGAGWALGPDRASGAALGALGVTTAVTAFLLSGEAELSIGFLAWDLLQVLLAAVVTRALLRRRVQAGRQEPRGERPT